MSFDTCSHQNTNDVLKYPWKLAFQKDADFEHKILFVFGDNVPCPCLRSIDPSSLCHVGLFLSVPMWQFLLPSIRIAWKTFYF